MKSEALLRELILKNSENRLRTTQEQSEKCPFKGGPPTKMASTSAVLTSRSIAACLLVTYDVAQSRCKTAERDAMAMGQRHGLGSQVARCVAPSKTTEKRRRSWFRLDRSSMWISYSPRINLELEARLRRTNAEIGLPPYSDVSPTATVSSTPAQSATAHFADQQLSAS